MKQVIFLGLFALILVRCNRAPDTSKLSSDFVVVTNFDNTADFGSYQTFVLPPYVALITSNANDTILDPQYGDQIIAAVKTNLESRGYTEVPNDKTAHLGVAITALKEVTIVSGWYPGSWWGYPGWGGCYWYYCGWYPYYPPYYPTYVYKTGSVIVELVDLKNASQADNKLHVIWTNWNGGALGSTSTDLANALKSIDQGFVQSPYITTH
jgi:uncharacterized protein DUF4136